MLNTLNGDTMYNVKSRNKLVLFFSQGHCINYKIKNISTGSHNTFSANYLHAVAKINDNTQLLLYSVGHCNSRLDSCWCFCIFIAHNHRLNVATPSKPKNG